MAPDGTPFWVDVETLAAAIGGQFDPLCVCPRRLRAPLAPPVAARKEGVALSLAEMRSGAEWWQGRVDVLLVEGVGGLLCPLTEDETIADLACASAIRFLLSAGPGWERLITRY